MSKLWQRCLDRLASEIPAEEVHTWLRPLQAEEVGTELRLLAPNTFVRDAVSERYRTRIEAVARHLEPELDAVRLDVGSMEATARPQPKRTPSASAQAPVEPLVSNIDPHYVFDNFIEGKSNQLGKAAALQVAMNPGR